MCCGTSDLYGSILLWKVTQSLLSHQCMHVGISQPGHVKYLIPTAAQHDQVAVTRMGKVVTGGLLKGG